jgi:hypothetical protein
MTMSNFFSYLDSTCRLLYAKKWLRFVLPILIFGISFIFFTVIESLVISLIFFAIFSGKGSRLLTLGALMFLILIPILQILDQYAGFTFPLFDGEELAVGVFYLLCLSVIFELLLQFLKNAPVQKTVSENASQHPLLNSRPKDLPIILSHEAKSPILLETKPVSQPAIVQPQKPIETRKFILVPKSFDSIQKSDNKPTVIDLK